MLGTNEGNVRVITTHNYGDIHVCTVCMYRARNGDRYSRQCDQNGSTGDQKFSSGHQIGDSFKITDIVKDAGHITLRLKLMNLATHNYGDIHVCTVCMYSTA